ncbi:hypothetical protein GCM10027594_06880 [Hymenobacter agri]|uniref:Uncharacterized protein n=1 Tax=Hymenobacter jeollabukensis TaxID=2025313 RepID=A0A5R8WHY9_9BACT|nr:hypothetical protein [Hymenobacter jeollabukensis]TLM88469.1 hypothetical protein FDY95_24210 [Hymenobacter jeollabukensis]
MSTYHQEAYLAIEIQPADAAEKERLMAVRKYVQAHTRQDDLRALAPYIRGLMGEGYQVVCGSSHIWLKREGTPERLAIVANRLNTAYRDWYEPIIPTGPRPSIRTEDSLPIPDQVPLGPSSPSQ